MFMYAMPADTDTDGTDSRQPAPVAMNGPCMGWNMILSTISHLTIIISLIILLTIDRHGLWLDPQPNTEATPWFRFQLHDAQPVFEFHASG
jgi:hypothetical protein